MIHARVTFPKSSYPGFAVEQSSMSGLIYTPQLNSGNACSNSNFSGGEFSSFALCGFQLTVLERLVVSGRPL